MREGRVTWLIVLKPFIMVGILLCIVWLFSGCGKKTEDTTQNHPPHKESPKQEEPKSPAPQEPKGDPRCTGVQSSSHTVVITKYGMSPPHLGLRDKAYEPRNLKIAKCDKVRWVNQDFRGVAMFHTATSTSPVFQFDTGGLTAGTTSQWVQFPVVGEVPYFCKPHPWMNGKVTVTP